MKQYWIKLGFQTFWVEAFLSAKWGESNFFSSNAKNLHGGGLEPFIRTCRESGRLLYARFFLLLLNKSTAHISCRHMRTYMFVRFCNRSRVDITGWPVYWAFLSMFSFFLLLSKPFFHNKCFWLSLEFLEIIRESHPHFTLL